MALKSSVTVVVGLTLAILLASTVEAAPYKPGNPTHRPLPHGKCIPFYEILSNGHDQLIYLRPHNGGHNKLGHIEPFNGGHDKVYIPCHGLYNNGHDKFHEGHRRHRHRHHHPSGNGHDRGEHPDNGGHDKRYIGHGHDRNNGHDK